MLPLCYAVPNVLNIYIKKENPQSFFNYEKEVASQSSHLSSFLPSLQISLGLSVIDSEDEVLVQSKTVEGTLEEMKAQLRHPT